MSRPVAASRLTFTAAGCPLSGLRTPVPEGGVEAAAKIWTVELPEAGEANEVTVRDEGASSFLTVCGGTNCAVAPNFALRPKRSEDEETRRVLQQDLNNCRWPEPCLFCFAPHAYVTYM